MAAHPLNILSLCAGIGGLDLGVKQAFGGAARTVCYVEREAYCAAILAARMADKSLDQAPIWSDLRTFDGRPWRGIVDGIIAGYPCQPFSYAGQRLGTIDPRHLWPDIARIIAEVKPGFCFFENVAGHLSLGFDIVRGELRELGYYVAAGLFSAAEIGAPHKRERLFILANRESRGCRELRESSGFDGFAERGVKLMANASSVRHSGDAPGQQNRLTFASDVLAHTRGERPQRECISGPTPWTTRRGYRAFPPGPGEHNQWFEIIRERPELAPAVKPAIRGVADGNAGRLDRLRALGNGVVPQCAAKAFVTLSACMMDTE